MKNKQMKTEDEVINKNSKKKKKKKKSVLKKILLIILIILLCAAVFVGYKTVKNGGGLKGFLATLLGENVTKVEDLDQIDFLLLGTSGGLTDTIIACSYDPKTQTAAMLSIPRDTFIGDNKKRATGSDKINSLYTDDNPDKVIKAVNEITGLNLHYYVVADTNALIELVDEIGGVTFNVPIDMDYDDSTQDLHIHLEAGEQVINGEEAEQLLRFRHNNNGTSYPTEYGDNDYGRMRTQREFIMAALNQTLKPENITKIGKLFDIAKNNVKTNFDFNTAKKYIPFAVEFNTSNIKTGMRPGESQKCNGVWLYIRNEEETEVLVNELFSTKPTPEGEQTTNQEDTQTIENKDISDIKIEILNGSSNKNNLSKVTERLKKAGYNVSKTGNTSNTSKTTIINYTNQSADVCNAIKKELGVGNISNSTSKGNSSIDITIIIGADYK